MAWWSSLIWDVTVVSPLVASYVDKAATNAGTVARYGGDQENLEILLTFFYIPGRAYCCGKILACSARRR